jgi:hypothetical protein
MISSQMLQHCSQGEMEKCILKDNAAIMKKYLRERDMIPDGQLTEIGFAELDDAPVETMKRIYKELNLGGLEDTRPAMKTYLDSVKQYRRNKYRPLSSSKLNKIHSAWEFWFKEFGYKQQGIGGL